MITKRIQQLAGISEQVDLEAERERARKELEKEREDREKEKEKADREREQEQAKREREREQAKQKRERDVAKREREIQKNEEEKEREEREREHEKNREEEMRDRQEVERKRAERERMAESIKQFGPYALYESAPVDTIAVIGRFQPFTEGHLKLYNSAKKKYKNVVIGMAVRSSPSMDKKNPFTDDEREKLIKKAIPGVQVARVPNIYYENVWDAVGKEVAIGIGKDRESSLQRMGGRTDGSGKFEYYVIPRPTGAVSATQVRQALLDGDEKLFKKIVPRGMHREYEWMRERILEVNK